MEIFEGESVYSHARLARLFVAVQRQNPSVSQLQFVFLHLVDVAENPDESTLERLKKVLTQDPLGAPLVRHRALTSLESPGVITCVVVPRLGTTSAWSSKATDIAHIAGLSSVLRM